MSKGLGLFWPWGKSDLVMQVTVPEYQHENHLFLNLDIYEKGRISYAQVAETLLEQSFR